MSSQPINPVELFSVKPNFGAESTSSVDLGDRMMTEFAKLNLNAAHSKAELSHLITNGASTEDLARFQAKSGDYEMEVRTAKMLATKFVTFFETLCKQ